MLLALTGSSAGTPRLGSTANGSLTLVGLTGSTMLIERFGERIDVGVLGDRGRRGAIGGPDIRQCIVDPEGRVPLDERPALDDWSA